MENAEIIGGIAGCLTTVAFFPQAYKVYKTKDTGSISLLMFIILNIGLLGWVAYGVLMKQLPVIIPNIITFLFAFYILFTKISQTRR